MNKIGIIGGGSWATALLKILLNNQIELNWWIRKPETVEFINNFNHNPDYLSYFHFNTQYLNISSNLTEVINNSDILIWSVPAAFMHDTLSMFEIPELKNKKHITAIKGILPQYTTTMSEYLNSVHKVPLNNIGMIAGPCHAEEVAMEKLSFLTIASSNDEITSLFADLLNCRYIKVKKNNDLIGVEYSAVLKNIFAVAAGICNGLGYGDNYQAILCVNAVNEARKFLDALCPTKRDVIDSAYTGDIIVTLYSQFSRNRVFGTLIGKGYSVKYSMIEMKGVAEGYYAVRGVKDIIDKIGVNMPIINAVYNILYNNISPAIEMKILADRND